MRYINYLLLFICCLCGTTINAAPKLIVGYGAHDAAPYAMTEAGYLTHGIIKDVIEELSDELNVDVEFLEVPRKRYARYLVANRIHLILISNPEWLGYSKDFDWSIPIFQETDVLVLAADKPTISQLNQLNGMRLGTIRGYIYPQLTELFNTKQLIRSDVRSMDLNFIRLKKGWIDAFVDSNILINYHLTQIEQSEYYQIAPLVISEHNIQAALAKGAPITIAQFNQALDKLKQNGVIDAILNRYKVKIKSATSAAH